MNEKLQLTDEILGAWLDGELPPAQHEALLQALDADPEAQARLQRLRLLNEQLRQAYALPQAGADDPLAALLRAPAEASADAPRAPASAVRRRRRNLSWALAASLAAVAVGALLSWRMVPVAGPAADPLQLALDQLPSGQQRVEAGVQIRPTLSFRADDGRWCRTFEQSGKAPALEALACRRDGYWQVLAQERSSAAGSEFRAAGGSGAVDAEMNRLGQAPALPAEEERKLIARRWAEASP